jgi:hypothetical protein
VFVSGSLTDALLQCETAPGHGSDHVAVIATFNVSIVHRELPRRHNFRGVDWKEFLRLLREHLDAAQLPTSPLSTKEDINAYTDTVTQALVTVIEAHVPLSCHSPYA